MSSRPRATRRLLVPILLATVVAGEVASLAAARDGQVDPPAAATAPAAAPAAAADQPVAGSGNRGLPIAKPFSRAVAQSSDRPPSGRSMADSVNIARRATPDHERPAPNRGAIARPEIPAEAESVVTGAGTRRGRNHVWIPSLGIDRSVESFPCDRSRPPDNFMYRWGCAGTNNVYLLGHAYSVFKPLHDAYVTGLLRKGMTVDYADANGRVRTYSVIWWKLTRPTGAAAWAWAAQPQPSMTLQTCVGRNSEYRLMVRLVAVG